MFYTDTHHDDMGMICSYRDNHRRARGLNKFRLGSNSKAGFKNTFEYTQYCVVFKFRYQIYFRIFFHYFFFYEYKTRLDVGYENNLYTVKFKSVVTCKADRQLVHYQDQKRKKFNNYYFSGKKKK